MIPNVSIQHRFAASVLGGVSADVSRLPITYSRGTRHTALRITLIPSAPTNGIIPRSFEGHLPDRTQPAEEIVRNTSNRPPYRILRCVLYRKLGVTP